MSESVEQAAPPLVTVVLVDRRHKRECAVWNVSPPYGCTCGLEDKCLNR